jgi:small-conductance mechanosensitive channel
MPSLQDLWSEEVREYLLAFLGRASQSALRIILVLLVAYLGLRLLRGAVKRLQGTLVKRAQKTETSPGAAAKRIATLTGLLTTLANVLVWSVAAVICLDQLGFDITPILAGAGILGLAVGFGAQSSTARGGSSRRSRFERSSFATCPASCTSFPTARSPRCRT